jgi:hypothetical protein
MNAIATPAIPNRIRRDLTPRSLSMTSVATELVSCLHDLTNSHGALVQALRARRDMISELNEKLDRNQPHGTEPDPEHVQVRAELYFLESAITRAEHSSAAVAERIALVKGALND